MQGRGKALADRMARSHPCARLTLVLGGLGLALAAANLQWLLREPPLGEPPPRSSDPTGAASLNRVPAEQDGRGVARLQGREAYRALTDLGMFHPGRSPVPQPPRDRVASGEAEGDSAAAQSLPAGDSPPRPRVELVATVVTGALRSALVREGADEDIQRLEPGDRLGDWAVVRIRRREVVLQASGGHQHTLEILPDDEVGGGGDW